MRSEHVFRRILFAADGSLPSNVARNITAFLAKRFNSEVTVIHVVSHEMMGHMAQKSHSERAELVPIGVPGSGTAQIEERIPQTVDTLQEEASRELDTWFHEKGRQIVTETVNLFKGEGIQVEEKLVQHVDPAEAIIREAQEGNYDLIAVGASEDEEKEPHLGSVAEKVSRHAQTSVLITREKGQMSKMLVPIDGSEASKKALAYAVELAKKTGTDMTLLHVQEPSLFRLRPDLSAQIGGRVLSKADEQTTGIKVKEKMQAGDPGKVITEMADREDFDIIVIGAKGHSTIGRFLLGDVSDHVVRYAHRSVLLIR